MPENQAVIVVQAWQDAVNTRDIERLVALSAPNIEIIGPRGSAYGHEVLRDWVLRAGLSVLPQRIFARGNIVVVAQRGIWRSIDTGTIISEADLASCFRVVDDLVAQVARYDHVDTALEFGGVTNRDEIIGSP